MSHECPHEKAEHVGESDRGCTTYWCVTCGAICWAVWGSDVKRSPLLTNDTSKWRENGTHWPGAKTFYPPDNQTPPPGTWWREPEKP